MRKAQLLFVIAIGLSALPAGAGNCSWRVAPTNMVFGNYSVFGSGSMAATASYEFRCTPGTQAVLTLTTGANSSSFVTRYMAAGGVLLPYNIFDDAAGTIIFGDGNGGTTARTVFNATTQNKDFADTFYGTMALGADVSPGTYTDTVTAVLSWDNYARSSTVTMTVTTVVQPECTVTATPIDFGDYNPVGTHATASLDGVGGINVYCTRGTVGTISLGPGLNFGGGSRRMTGPPGSFLSYQLFSNSIRTLVWSVAPNTVSATSTTRFSPLGGGLVVYGRVPAGQDPNVGAHADTVQATVNY